MNNLDAVIEQTETILQKMGFHRHSDSGEVKIVDELYSQDYTFLKECDTMPMYTVQTVLYKNEYHDEEHTLIQATAICSKAGLGLVKKNLQAFAEQYIGESVSLGLRPAFIYQTVPAVEGAVYGVRFGAGGLVRPEVMRKYGFDDRTHVGYSFVLLPEALEQMRKA